MKCSPFPWNGNSSSRNSVLVLLLGLTFLPEEAQGEVRDELVSTYKSYNQKHFEPKCGYCGEMEKKSKQSSLREHPVLAKYSEGVKA